MGHYRLWVENNEVRNHGPTPFSVRVTTIDGTVEDRHFDDCQEFEEVVCFEWDVVNDAKGDMHICPSTVN